MKQVILLSLSLLTLTTSALANNCSLVMANDSYRITMELSDVQEYEKYLLKTVNEGKMPATEANAIFNEIGERKIALDKEADGLAARYAACMKESK